MKRKIYGIVALFAIATCLMTSCNSENAMEETSDVKVFNEAKETANKQEFESISNQINTLSVNTFGEQPKTRSIWTFLKKVIDITIADVSGACDAVKDGKGVAATVATAVQASIQKAQNGYVGKFKGDVMTGGNTIAVGNTSSVLIKPAAGLRTVDSIGYYHNEVVNRLYNQKSNLPNGLNAKVYAQIVATQTEKVMNLTAGKLTSDEATMNYLVAKITNFQNTGVDKDVDELISEVAKTNSREAAVLTVIRDYLYGMQSCENIPNAEEYSAKVLEIIDKSSLNDDCKEQLRVGVTVGYASANLWYSDEITAE